MGLNQPQADAIAQQSPTRAQAEVARHSAQGAPHPQSFVGDHSHLGRVPQCSACRPESPARRAKHLASEMIYLARRAKHLARKHPRLARKANIPAHEAQEPARAQERCIARPNGLARKAPQPCAQAKTPCAQAFWPCDQAKTPCAPPNPGGVPQTGRNRAGAASGQAPWLHRAAQWQGGRASARFVNKLAGSV
jgi:hypothetical protein